ncbi:MAG TPA: hypothetical protein VGM90_40655 [Kofleriaceae bacterium]
MIVILLPGLALAAPPGITEPDPASRCDEDEPDPANPGSSERLDVWLRVREACEPKLVAFGSIAARTSVDSSEDTSVTGAAVDVAGETALRVHGVQLRGGADGRLGAGASSSSSAGAEATIASPMGFFASEVSAQLGVHRVPSLFDGRSRAPGRYDELTVDVRSSLLSAEAGAKNVVFLPIGVEGIGTQQADREEDPLRRWSWTIGLADGRSKGPKFATRVKGIIFRAEQGGDISLSHLDVLDIDATDDHGGSLRLRFGAARFTPNDIQSDPGTFTHTEGEFSCFAKSGDTIGGLGFSSDYSITSDALLGREQRLRGELGHSLAGGLLRGSSFIARTRIFDPRVTPFMSTVQWTGGVRASYERRIDGLNLAMVSEAGRTFHGWAETPVAGEPAWSARAYLSLSASKGRRATPNRVAP